MIWMAGGAMLYLGAEWVSLLRQRKWRELFVHTSLTGIGLVMAALVQWHLWLKIDLLAPIEAVFMPLTKWFYGIL